MIYGYSKAQVNEYGLLDLKEITFSASPEVLRQIATFLNQSASMMEDGWFDKCSHRHIQDEIKDWDEKFPDRDIIVMPE